MNNKILKLPSFLQSETPGTPRVINANPVTMEPDLEDLARAVERTRDALARATSEYEESVAAYLAEQERRKLPCRKP